MTEFDDGVLSSTENIHVFHSLKGEDSSSTGADVLGGGGDSVLFLKRLSSLSNVEDQDAVRLLIRHHNLVTPMQLVVCRETPWNFLHLILKMSLCLVELKT